ncbi:hypothetical protein [Microbispora sp. CA-102843]|uniref:hypothetical protein n=1 Tax=Microbispora sp. CA-102843 TaxID=3239952 RepID=UPI003D9283EE
MSETRLYFVPPNGEPVDLSDHVTDIKSDLTFASGGLVESAWPSFPVTIRLRGHLSWSGFAVLFPSHRHPRSRRVKTEYHRRRRNHRSR